MSAATWPDWWIPYVTVFQRGLGSLQSLSGARVTSYVRSVDHNREVGGDPHSQHLLGIAADLAPSSYRLVQIAQSMGFGYVLDEGDHVHVQLFPAGSLPGWLFDWLAPPSGVVSL